MTNVHQCGKVDFLFLSLCFQNDLLLALDLLQLPCWDRLELFPFFNHCWFCIRNFIAWDMRTNLRTRVSWLNELRPFLRDVIFIILWQSRFRTLSRRFMSIYDACMLWFLDFVGSAVCFPMPVRTLRVVFSLQGTAVSIGTCSLPLRFFHGFFELFIIRIDKIDASRLSRIVELRFFDSPLLFFLSLSSFWHLWRCFWPNDPVW